MGLKRRGKTALRLSLPLLSVIHYQIAFLFKLSSLMQNSLFALMHIMVTSLKFVRYGCACELIVKTLLKITYLKLWLKHLVPLI